MELLTIAAAVEAAGAEAKLIMGGVGLEIMTPKLTIVLFETGLCIIAANDGGSVIHLNGPEMRVMSILSCLNLAEPAVELDRAA